MFGLPNPSQQPAASSTSTSPVQAGAPDAPAPQPPVQQPQQQPPFNPQAAPQRPAMPFGGVPNPAGMPGAAGQGADLKYQKIMEAMMTSSIGGKRNELPVGTGLFLIKEGIFKVTPTQGARLTSFSLYCIRGIDDAQNLIPASPQYTGPRVGETYEYAVFHDSKYPNILGSQYLQITAACMGWTPDQVKMYQASPEGQQVITEMTARILCVDAHGNQVTENGQPITSIISNQAILEITKKSQIKDKKVNGQPVYDATGQKIQISVTNVYFNKRIWMDDLASYGLTEEETIKAFGSQEAAQAAYQIEQQYKQG